MGKTIPKQIKTEVLQIVEDFNDKHNTTFQMSFRGRFAYLSKMEQQGMDDAFLKILAEKMGIPREKMPLQKASVQETKLGRLEYNGEMDNWSFAVFRYSRENYDPEEWMFPGAEELDGTIEGALRAGMQIYP
jgi:hypothetical protein